MSFVLDASVALSWCFQDQGGDYVLDVLDALGGSGAVVPATWAFEVSNGLLVAGRRGRLDAAAAERFIRVLLALPIAQDAGSRGGALQEVRRLAQFHRLSAYDAAYLELAVRLGVPLATVDEPLAAAAEGEGVGRFRGAA